MIDFFIINCCLKKLFFIGKKKGLEIIFFLKLWKFFIILFIFIKMSVVIFLFLIKKKNERIKFWILGRVKELNLFMISDLV